MEAMNKERESGVELLKIIAIMCIVISHISQTLELCGLNLNVATTNIQYIILMLFRQFGVIGNNIFFISSAWFLCGSVRKRNNQKIIHMLLDVWIISMLYLVVFVIFVGDLSTNDIVKSVFPTTFMNNWYITCYLLFYVIFPWLNEVIEKMSKKELLTANIIAFFLYYGMAFMYNTAFFATHLMLFIVMYFFVAYIKLYMKSVLMRRKVNYILLSIGFIGYIGIALLTNFIGLKVDVLENHVLWWWNMSNPFCLLIAIALFLIFKQKKFKSSVINRVAGLSLLIYLIHENLLLRTYFRPAVFYYIYTHFGYKYIVLWVLVFAVVLFVASMLVSFLYEQTIQRVSAKFSKWILEKITPLYNKWISRLMKFD